MSDLNTNILNQSNLNSMDSEKLEGYLAMLDENRKNYIKVGNYLKAEITSKKILKLRTVENKKLLEELKQSFINSKNNFEDEKAYQINTIKEEFEEEYLKIKEKLKEFELKLNEKNKKEIQDFIEKFDKKYPKVIMPNNILQIDNLKKTLFSLLRANSFVKAQEVQKKIKELESINPDKNEDFINIKTKKLKKEVKLLNMKHDKEFKLFQQKFVNDLYELEKKRDKKIEKINLKFKNRKMKLEQKLKYEIKIYKRPERKLSQSLIKSSSLLPRCNSAKLLNNSKGIMNQSKDNLRK